MQHKAALHTRRTGCKPIPLTLPAPIQQHWAHPCLLHLTEDKHRSKGPGERPRPGHRCDRDQVGFSLWEPLPCEPALLLHIARSPVEQVSHTPPAATMRIQALFNSGKTATAKKSKAVSKPSSGTKRSRGWLGGEGG